MARRSFVFGLTALALVLFLSRTVLAANKTHEGKVVKAGDGKLVMTDKKGIKHTHVVPDTAKITCDGKECKLEDLKEGDKVKVTTGADDKTVTKIEGKAAEAIRK